MIEKIIDSALIFRPLINLLGKARPKKGFYENSATTLTIYIALELRTKVVIVGCG